jgi:signal-transduction protein with cAMP-binding, CBS, and nucleotidyltransferase domain
MQPGFDENTFGHEETMTVGRICQREVDLAEAAEPISTAAQRMAARNVGSLLIVDKKQHPIGMLTDRDIAVRVVAAGLDPETTNVDDVMTLDPRTISEFAPIEDALVLMRAHGIRRLAVVRPAGAIVGIVTLDDVLSLFAGEMRQVERLLRKASPAAIVES